MNRGVWHATVHGVTKSQTELMTEYACYVCVYVCLLTNKTLLLLYVLGWEEVHTFMFSGAFLCVLNFIVIKWNLINIY